MPFGVRVRSRRVYVPPSCEISTLFTSPRTPVPDAWRRYVLERHGVETPDLMGDRADTWWRSWEVGYDPADATDQSIMATRKAVFPMHGLDPWFD